MNLEACVFTVSIQKGAHVLTDAFFDFNVETGFGWHLEKLPGGVRREIRWPIELHAALTRDDFHPLRLVCAKMKLTGINQTERFLGAIREQNRVTGNFAVEIDVRFGERGDAPKFFREG